MLQIFQVLHPEVVFQIQKIKLILSPNKKFQKHQQKSLKWHKKLFKPKKQFFEAKIFQTQWNRFRVKSRKPQIKFFMEINLNFFWLCWIKKCFKKSFVVATLCRETNGKRETGKILLVSNFLLFVALSLTQANWRENSHKDEHFSTANSRTKRVLCLALFDYKIFFFCWRCLISSSFFPSEEFYCFSSLILLTTFLFPSILFCRTLHVFQNYFYVEWECLKVM